MSSLSCLCWCLRGAWKLLRLRLRVPVAGGRVHGRRIDFRYAICIECLKGGVSIQGAADDIDDDDIIEGSSIISST